MSDIWTIGHWNCREEIFIGNLDEYGIEVLVDIRSLPGSRRSPQYNKEAMPDWLANAGIEYLHLGILGGRRRNQSADAEVNSGWKNPSFKNYADYTLTDDYELGIEFLSMLAEHKRTAIMCGEPMPWRCHRSLVSNTLTVNDWNVWHIMTGAKIKKHTLGAWGATPVISDGKITYPLLSDRIS